MGIQELSTVIAVITWLQFRCIYSQFLFSYLNSSLSLLSKYPLVVFVLKYKATRKISASICRKKKIGSEKVPTWLYREIAKYSKSKNDVREITESIIMPVQCLRPVNAAKIMRATISSTPIVM